MINDNNLTKASRALLKSPIGVKYETRDGHLVKARAGLDLLVDLSNLVQRPTTTTTTTSSTTSTTTKKPTTTTTTTTVKTIESGTTLFSTSTVGSNVFSPTNLQVPVNEDLSNISGAGIRVKLDKKFPNVDETLLSEDAQSQQAFFDPSTYYVDSGESPLSAIQTTSSGTDAGDTYDIVISKKELMDALQRMTELKENGKVYSITELASVGIPMITVPKITSKMKVRPYDNPSNYYDNTMVKATYDASRNTTMVDTSTLYFMGLDSGFLMLWDSILLFTGMTKNGVDNSMIVGAQVDSITTV